MLYAANSCRQALQTFNHLRSGTTIHGFGSENTKTGSDFPRFVQLRGERSRRAASRDVACPPVAWSENLNSEQLATGSHGVLFREVAHQHRHHRLDSRVGSQRVHCPFRKDHRDRRIRVRKDESYPTANLS